MPLKETERLLQVVQRLRKECPWDRKQTHRSLVPYLIEEAYEAADAIEKKQSASLCEELGDVLLQVVLHSVIANEKRHFNLERVARGITEKMIRRHPHIFAERKNNTIRTASDQTKNWSRIKNKEKPNKSLLSGLPKSLPALQRAQRYGDIAASVGFDWKTTQDVFKKVHEELGELSREIKRSPPNKRDVEMELGDLLFVLTRLAAHLKVDAERALRRSADKFERRFQVIESHHRKRNRSISDSTLEELETIWSEAKRKSSRH